MGVKGKSMLLIEDDAKIRERIRIYVEKEGYDIWEASDGEEGKQMMEAILLDEKRIMPVSTFLKGKYGVDGLFLGVPVILGAKGVEQVLEIQLTEEQHKGLLKSAKGVKP